ncbi:hypothetical protein [Roseibium album]|uniref:hypothetical protein n=1 Tax=Roseibium album TaxID=311410 RepID=UPI00391BF9B5
MTISCGNDTQILRNRPQVLGINMDRLALFFRQKYPVNTAAYVAKDLGVAVRTAEGWLGSSPSAPRAAVLIKGILVYGPEFLTVLLPETPDWLSEAARNEQRAKTLQDIAELQRLLDQ